MYLNNKVIYHSVGKPADGEAYTQKIQVVLKSPLLDTLVTFNDTPFSSTTLDSTYILNITSTYLWVYRKSPRYT